LREQFEFGHAQNRRPGNVRASDTHTGKKGQKDNRQEKPVKDG
jgi:hypothetical protein